MPLKKNEHVKWFHIAMLNLSSSIRNKCNECYKKKNERFTDAFTDKIEILTKLILLTYSSFAERNI